jgi:hypothetical protein
MMPDDKPLPHSGEAESALLCGIILGGDGPWLDASEFHLPFNQSLCQALTRLKREGKPTNDLVLLSDLLSPSELENCGGIAYISGLLDGFPKVSNLEHYAKIIRDKAAQRRAIAVADKYSKALLAANGDAGQVVNDFISNLAATLPKGGVARANALRTVSVTELLRMDVKPREMILSPFLPTQGLAMLYSKRGVGKTFIALGLSVAVAGGTDFLKWTAPKRRGVLYVDGEMPCSTLKQRLEDIVAGTDIAEPLDNLHLITPDLQSHGLPDLATAAGQNVIEVALAEHKCELLVLDNLSALVRDIKENEGEGWLPVQDWALDLRRRGISVLFVHHAGKSGTQRGTSRREDLLDSVVTLKHPNDYNPDEGMRCEVHYEKSRGFFGEDARPFEVKRMDGPSGEAQWVMVAPETSIGDRVREMRKLGLSGHDIAKELGVGKSTIYRILSVPVSQS